MGITKKCFHNFFHLSKWGWGLAAVLVFSSQGLAISSEQDRASLEGGLLQSSEESEFFWPPLGSRQDKHLVAEAEIEQSFVGATVMLPALVSAGWWHRGLLAYLRKALGRWWGGALSLGVFASWWHYKRESLELSQAVESSLWLSSMEEGAQEPQLNASFPSSLVKPRRPKKKTPALYIEDLGDGKKSLAAYAGFADEPVLRQLQKLKVLYSELSYEQWLERIKKVVGSENEEALKNMEPQQVLSDIHDHFEFSTHHIVADLHREVSRGLRAEYIFLTRIMELKSSSGLKLAKKFKIHPSSISRIYRNVVAFLKNYPLYEPSVHSKAQRDFVTSEPYKEPKKLGALKQAFLALSVEDLKNLLNPWVVDEVLDQLTPAAFMDYMERNWPAGRVHIFLSHMLRLDSVSEASVVQLYHKKPRWFPTQKQVIRGKLSSLNSKDLVVLVHHPAELVEAARRSWQEVLLGDHHEVLKALNIDPFYKDDFFESAEEIRQRLEEEDHRGGVKDKARVKEFFFLRELLGWDHYEVSHMIKVFEIPRYVAAAQDRNTRDKVAFFLDHFQRSFQEKNHLFLHQKKMIQRYSREELSLVPLDYRIELSSNQDLAKSLDLFIKKHDLATDIQAVSLLKASLGFPRLSEAHLAALFQISEDKIIERTLKLREQWLADGAVLSNWMPLSDSEVLEKFENLTKEQWLHLKNQWMAYDLGGDEFRSKVRDFMHEHLKDDPFRIRVFLSLVLKLEQPSRHTIEKIVDIHLPDKHLPKYSVNTKQKKSVKQKINLINLNFQNKVLDHHKSIDGQHLPKTKEELHENLVNKYKYISKERMVFLAHRWGFEGKAGVKVFRSKLKSFVRYLLAEDPSSFDVFLAFNLGLINMNSEYYSSLVGTDSTNVFYKRKNITHHFKDYIERKSYEDKNNIVSDLSIEMYYSDNPDQLISAATELGLKIGSFVKLRKDLFFCSKKIIDSSKDFLIFSARIIKIVPLTVVDLSDHLKLSTEAIEARTAKMRQKFSECISELR